MKQFFTCSLMALALGFSAQAYAEDVKLFSFTADKEAEGKALTFSISAIDGGTIFVDWGTGDKEEYNIADYDGAGWVFSEVKGTLGSGVVVVYAAEGVKINYVDLDWTKDDDELAKITSVQILSLPDVKEFSVSNNHLQTLDVSSCSSLATLNAYDNQLSTLTLGEANSVLASVNVSNSYNVTTGEANENAGSNNVAQSAWNLLPALKTLNITGNPIAAGESIDLSKNVNLGTLTINCCGVEALDLTALTSLKTLNAQWNNLKTIDLSNMIAKSGTVSLNHNYLSEVKMPDTTTDKFTRINLPYNNLTFNTLPAVGLTAKDNNYVYAPQAEVAPEVKNNVVDLSSLAMVGDSATVFVWTRGENPIADTDYSVENGVFTFNATGDYFCSMTNEAFPALTLTTNMITISDVTSGVAAIEESAAPVEYFNLQGVKVSGNEPGIYVRRQGNKVSKVIVK